MKKRKFNLLLELATLCLCVAAIAFGVYSAKNASLNVSGTVGFTAHNCDVYVAGKITGGIDADLNSITKYVSDAENATEDTFRSIGESYNWNIGTIYFDDINATGNEIAKPITITLKVYNKSAFKVKFTFNENFLPHDHLNVTVDNSNITMEANETESNAHTINVTITLKDENLTAIKLEQSSVIADFQRWTQFYTQSVSEVQFGSDYDYEIVGATTRLCTTMGHSIIGDSEYQQGTDGTKSTSLTWYAFAVKGDKTSENNYNTKPADIFNSNTTTVTNPISITNTYVNNGITINETWYSLSDVDMSKVADYKNHTYWFIQQYVVAGGTQYNDENKEYHQVFGISFDSDGKGYSESGKEKSDIYNLLNSEGSYASSGYKEKTGIVDEDLFTKVETRNVNETYNNTTYQFSSQFWLINYEELGLLCNENISYGSYGYKKAVAYSITHKEGPSYWWLRSPNADYEGIPDCIDWTGFFSPDPDGMFITNATAGIRAAFQITL